ncbi:ABC transporter substrate-binding protein [Phyllobacterium endophyticum]|uniref:ABC transporter substrate-binding protein n=2 Tax=Phyllobacterium endophyticum TaxID=1149773 RepID=A0A2P7AMA5_9HYPH|nr:ABC transporter substrate-binding protein [Phyllobacterium endophyticum]PSH55341.1 ABC transporter substrate-binding protein [Phyllobacterium endophyticum]TXR48899.1 ABC transporter substrate-binding protein [Phyllobacterium endophyticum]TYR43394.1 ABC transporter substrate-binding protein [Phyllobacterium endophyticum]
MATRFYRRFLCLSFVLLLALGFSTHASAAAETIRVGVLKFGTVNWELDTIKHHKFDEKHGIDVDVRFFASEDATNVAMMAGDVDIIVTDWLWVSRQRQSGEDLTFVPYSSSVGALMVPVDSPIKSLADLKGRKIGVAGGPLDKSWLLMQGYAKHQFSLDLPANSEIIYGTPPLLAEKAQQGELEAVLNFWNFCARLEANGFRRLVSTSDAARALGATGNVSAIGYIFHEKWAHAHPDAIAGFIKASREAKALLGSSNEEWQRLAPVVKAEGRALEILRDRYREGIPARSVEDEEADAIRLYAILAELGGERLVGPGKTLAPGTFWRTD